MKRLRSLLLDMPNHEMHFSTLYDSPAIVIDEEYDAIEECMPEFYLSDTTSIVFSMTHKLALDKPTVTINISCAELGIDNATIGVADHCLRRFKPYLDELNAELYNRSRPDNESGKYYIRQPGGEILEGNSAYIAYCPQKDYRNLGGISVRMLEDGIERPPVLSVCLRIQVQLPQKHIKKTVQMLTKDLPKAINRFRSDFNIEELKHCTELFYKQSTIREWLKTSEYCAFIANGSILPRAKGMQLPLDNAVPFKSTESDEIEIFGVKGMGIRRGVTVITGGGYSGKSTLLDAISAGIYDHVPGDGRELCITDETAVTIASEDGRCVKRVNISPFIKWLPGGNTKDFSTEHASGSTSQAANIMEAVSYGSKLLLIDEDRSATNFMIRDKMMKELIEKEPITPFTDRVRELHQRLDVSTILVIGGSGEYLGVADKVYMMDDYLIHDVTECSKEICQRYGVTTDDPAPTDWKQHRILSAEGFTSFPENSGKERLEVSEMGFIFIGEEKIDIRGLSNIVTSEQLQTIGFMLRHIEITNADSEIDIEKKLDEVWKRVETEGVEFLYSSYFTTCGRFLDMPRKSEVRAVINRMRRVKYGTFRRESSD